MDVKTVQEFLSYTQELQNTHTGAVLYFRGESRCDWELRPSVMRDGLVRYEGEMLTEFLSRQPNEFYGRNSALSQWMLAQHHGLKTRFLDVSRNPLVALFHACESNLGEPGKLHIFATPQFLIKPFNSDAISIVANFARLPPREQDTLLGTAGTQSNYNYNAVMLHLIQLIREEKPHFEERIDAADLYRVFIVEPQQSSERIRAQSGAFLLSALHRRFERDEILRMNSRALVYNHYSVIIPHDYKSSIRDVLRLLNITRETLFPGLDESASEITERFRQRLSDGSATASDTP